MTYYQATTKKGKSEKMALLSEINALLDQYKKEGIHECTIKYYEKGILRVTNKYIWNGRFWEMTDTKMKTY